MNKKLIKICLIILVVILNSYIKISCNALSDADHKLYPLHVEGNWVVNEEGRVVILRGVNLVIKTPNQTPIQLGFGEKDAKLLKERGFKLVRLGLLWDSTEPQPDQFNEAYLKGMKETVKLLADHGIYSLIDFHQDMYSQLYGDGAPAWATIIAGTNTPNLGFFCNLFGGSNVRTDIDNAYSSFWANAVVNNLGLQDHYVKMVKHVVEFFRDVQDNIFGYDIMNEPFIGNDWASCLSGCPAFDAELTSFYTKVVNAIHEINPKAIVWYEPNLLFGGGIPTYVGEVSDKGNIGFSYHNADSNSLETPTNLALNYQKQFNVPLCVGEFYIGSFGPTRTFDVILGNLAQNNRAMVSSTYWAYFNNPTYTFCPSAGVPADGRLQGLVFDMTQPLVSPNVDFELLNILTEVYPQEIGGTPIEFSYDHSSNQFNMIYSPIAPNSKTKLVNSLTKIFVPNLNYPNGYDVNIENGIAVSDIDNQTLIVRVINASNNVTITITPKASKK